MQRTCSLAFIGAVCTAAIALSFVAELAAAGHSADEWKSRRIYQVLTDRFAVPPDSSNPNPSCNTNLYCGGSFTGLQSKLDYIKGMGFNAIWISPIPVNYHQGYHGYWAIDFTKVNPHFGTAQELQAFVNASHAMDIWVMIDIVLNHVGPIGQDFSSVTPFNQASHYHPDCQVNQYICQTQEVQDCRLAHLADLDQDVPFVKQGLFTYVQWLLQDFGFDGIRADTIMYIKNQFWVDLQQSNQLGGTYVVGEVWSTFACELNYTREGIDATLNYELYYALRNVYGDGNSMRQLGTTWRKILEFPHPNWEANFVDNQDNNRFLCDHNNVPAYKSALAHNFFTTGHPIVYYGTEQLFNGCIANNQCREPMWPTNYDNTTHMYAFLKGLNAAWDAAAIHEHDAHEIWQDDSIYCFYRGMLLVCTTNSNSAQTRQIPNLPFQGKRVCNWFNQNSCVAGFSTMNIEIPSGGEPLLLFGH